MTKKIKQAIGRWLCIIMLLFLGTNIHAAPDSDSDSDIQPKGTYSATNAERLPPSPSNSSGILLEDILFYSSIVVAYFVFDWYRSRKEITDITY